MCAVDIVVTQGIAKKLKTLQPLLHSGLAVFMAHKPSNHRDGRVDSLSNGPALMLEGCIIFINPTFGIGGIDKGKTERAHAQTRRLQDRGAVATCHPEWWMRLLEWFGDDVARRHGEMLAVVTR